MDIHCSCCASEDLRGRDDVVDGVPTILEAIHGPGGGAAIEARPPLEALPLREMTGESTFGASSSASPRQKEEARNEMRCFVSSVVRGRLLTLVKELPEAPFILRLNAKLQLSGDQQILTLSAGDMSLSFSTAGITNIFQASADGTQEFPDGVVERLQETELPRLLRMYHTSPEGRCISLCFLEATPTSTEAFLKGMRFLRLQAQHRAATAARPKASRKGAR